MLHRRIVCCFFAPSLGVLALVLGQLACAPPPPEGDLGAEGGATEDGQTRGVVDLRPGQQFSLVAQCNEWFSCDLDVTMVIHPDGYDELRTEARERADSYDIQGFFQHELPLYRATLTDRREALSFTVDVVARINGERIDGSPRVLAINLFAGDLDLEDGKLELYAESEHADAVYDIAVESLQDFERRVPLFIDAEWY